MLKDSSNSEKLFYLYSNITRDKQRSLNNHVSREKETKITDHIKFNHCDYSIRVEFEGEGIIRDRLNNLNLHLQDFQEREH